MLLMKSHIMVGWNWCLWTHQNLHVQHGRRVLFAKILTENFLTTHFPNPNLRFQIRMKTHFQQCFPKKQIPYDIPAQTVRYLRVPLLPVLSLPVLPLPASPFPFTNGKNQRISNGPFLPSPCVLWMEYCHYMMLPEIGTTVVSLHPCGQSHSIRHY